MKIPDDAAPGVMPIDRETWLKQLNLSNFVNSYYQFRDISDLRDVRKILIVGPGQGLDTEVFRWRPRCVIDRL
jgi:hypothetical protein